MTPAMTAGPGLPQPGSWPAEPCSSPLCPLGLRGSAWGHLSSLTPGKSLWGLGGFQVPSPPSSPIACQACGSIVGLSPPLPTSLVPFAALFQVAGRVLLL